MAFGNLPYPEWNPLDPNQRDLPVFGLDFETAAIMGSRPNIPLEMGMQQFQWNKAGDAFKKAGPQFRALIWPTLPTGERVPLSQIESYLSEEIPGKGTVSGLTGLNIGMWQNPRKHGYSGVYTPTQIGSILQQKLTLTGKPPVILGSNVNKFDMPMANWMMKSAGYQGLESLQALSADTYLTAIGVSTIPQGQRGLQNLANMFGMQVTQAHRGIADVQLAAQLYPKVYSMLQGVGQPAQPQPVVNNQLPISQVTIPTGGGGMPPNTPPPSYPVGQTNMPPRRGPGLSLQKPDMQTFQEALTLGLSRNLPDYIIEQKQIEENQLRLSIAKNLGGGKRGPGLVLDLAPGYKTPFGFALEATAESGWRGNFSPELNVAEMGTPKGVQLRTPLEAFSEYVKQTFSPEMAKKFPSGNPNQWFQFAYTMGQQVLPNAPIAGGMQWVGPQSTPRAAQEMASRVAVTINPDIKDHQAVFNMIRNRSNLARQQLAQGQTGPDLENWAALKGYVPIKDEGDRLRMTMVGSQAPGDQMDVVGKGVEDALKRRKIMPWAREQAELLQLNPGTGRAEVALPRPIGRGANAMGLGARGGFRILGGSLPGTDERAIGYVQPRTAVMSNSVMAGTMTMYDDYLRQYFAASNPTDIKVEIPQLSMYQLKGAKFRFGHFKQTGEGEAATYEPIGEEGQLPAAIGPGESAIIGLMDFETKEGPRRTEPIRFSSPGRATYFTEKPRLNMGPVFSQTTGEFGGDIWKNPTDPTDWVSSDIYREEIQKNFPGTVEALSGGQVSLRIKANTQTGMSLKGTYKVTPFVPMTVKGQKINQQVQLQMNEQELINTQIYGLTGEQKLPEYAFAAHFLSLPPARQEEMLGEFKKVNPELATALQTYAAGQHAKTETVWYAGKPIETYGGLNFEEMADIYAKNTPGETYTRQSTAERMTAQMRRLVEAQPLRKQWERYEYASSVKSQWYFQSVVSESEKLGLEKSLYQATIQNYQNQGIDIETPEGQAKFEALYPGGFERLKGEVFQFKRQRMPKPSAEVEDLSKYVNEAGTPVMAATKPLGPQARPAGKLPRENYYKFSVRAPAQLSTFYAPIVPEHLAQLTHIGYPEISALNAVVPNIADWLGLGVRDLQGQQSTGYVPRAVQAWRNIGEVASYRASELAGRIQPSGVNIITPELAAQVGAFSGTDLAEMDKLFPEPGPLYNPQTGELMEKPGWIKDVSTFGYEEDSQVKVALSHWSRRAIDATKQFAQGGTTDTSEAMREIAEMRNQAYSSKARSAQKAMESRFLPQATGGRYSAIMGIPLGAGFINRQQEEYQLTEMARAGGFSPYQRFQNISTAGGTISWVDLAKKQIENQGFIGQMVSRWPQVQTLGGTIAAPFLTESNVRNMGLSYPSSTLVRNNQIYPGSALTSGYAMGLGIGALQFVGDWDADPGFVAMLAKASKGSGIDVLANEEWRSYLKQGGAQRWGNVTGYLRGGFGGGANTPGGEYQVVAKELQGLLESNLSGKHGREVSSGTNFLSRLAWEDMFKESTVQLQAGTSGSGQPYTARQLMESTATALGWSPKEINKAGTAQAVWYQEYLDIKTGKYKKRGGPSSIQSLLNTGFFGVTSGGEYKLVAKARADTNFSSFWWGGSGKNDPQRGALFSGTMGRLLSQAVGEDIAEMDNPNYQLASYLMAEKEEDVPALQAQMEKLAAGGATPYEAVHRTLWGSENTTAAAGQKSYLATHDVTKSPLGSAFIARSYWRSMGEFGRKPKSQIVDNVEVENIQRTATQPVPWLGELTSLQGLKFDPTMMNIRDLYNYQRKTSGWRDAEGDTRYSPIPPERKARLVNLRDTIKSQGKTPGMLLDYIVGQEEARSAALTLGSLGANASKNLSDEKLIQLSSGRSINVGSTTLPMFALSQNLRGVSPEIAEQRKLEFAGQQLFGIKPELLQTESDLSSKEYFTGQGQRTEEEFVPKIIEREGKSKFYRFEKRGGQDVPIVGPIYGVSHEAQSVNIPISEILTPELAQKYPSLKGGAIGAPDISLHWAPDIYAATFDPATGQVTGRTQRSIKWSQNLGNAQLKPSEMSNLLQEAQYAFMAEARLGSGKPVDKQREMLEPMIRESPWFKENWSTEALQAAMPGMSMPQIQAEQERVINENLKVHQRAMLFPLNVAMHSFTGPAGARQEVTTPEGESMNDALGKRFRSLTALGAFRAQQFVSTPGNIRGVMSSLVSQALMANTDVSSLGSLFTSMGASPLPWQEYKAQRSTTITEAGSVPGTPIPSAELNRISQEQMARNAVMPATSVPIVTPETIAAARGEPLQNAQQAVQAGALGGEEWIPTSTYNPTTGVYTQTGGIKTQSNLGRTLREIMGGGVGGVATPGGEGTTLEPGSKGERSFILKHQWGGGGASFGERGIQQVRRALIDTENLAATTGFNEFATNAQEKLGAIAGIAPEDIWNYSIDELMVQARGKNLDEYNQFYAQNKQHIQQGAKTYRAVYTAASALQRKTFSMNREEVNQIGMYMGMDPEEAASTLNATYTGSSFDQQKRNFSQGLQIASLMEATAKDMGTSGRRGWEPTNDMLDEFTKKVKAATEHIEKWSAVVNDSTKTAKQRLEAEQQVNLGEARTASALAQVKFEGVKDYLARGEAIQWEGINPKDRLAAIESFKSLEAQVGAAKEKETKLEEEIIPGVQSGKIKAEDLDPHGLGRMSRRMLGGFGLMYMQSVLGIAIEPTKLGYDARLKQAEQIEGIYGQTYGGMYPTVNPEQELQRAQAVYGGAGYTTIRKWQTAATKNPNLQGALGMAQAALGVGALGATMAMWGAPFTAPMIAGGAILAAGAAAGINIYGAANEPDINSVALAAQARNNPNLMRDLQYFDRNVPQGQSIIQKLQGFAETVPMANLRNLTNMQYWGFQYNQKFTTNQDQLPMVGRLNDMSAYNAGGGTNMRGYLASQGVTSAAEANYWMGQYTQVESATYPNIPIEGLANARMLQDKYGLTLTEGDRGTRAYLASGLAQGVPYEQTGAAAAYSPSLSGAERRARAGQLIQSWVDSNEGLTTGKADRLIEGAQRFGGLGPFAPTFNNRATLSYLNSNVDVNKLTAVSQQEDYLLKLQNMPESNWQLFQTEYSLYTSRVMAGLPAQQPQQENFQTPLSPEQNAMIAQDQRRRGLRDRSRSQLEAGYFQLGIAAPDLNPTDSMTMGRMNQVADQLNYAAGMGSQLISGGMNQYKAEQISQIYGTQMNAVQFETYRGLQSMNPLNWSAWALENTRTASRMPSSIQGLGGAVSTRSLGMVDINAQGNLTGMGWGTSSLANAFDVAINEQTQGVTRAQAVRQASMQTATAIWGADYANRKDLSQESVSALIEGGQFQLQLLQQQKQAQVSAAQSSSNMAMLLLQGEYTPKFWAMEDQQRGLNQRQSQWGFEMQDQQMAMQRSQFYENMGMNRRQQITQRGWTQQDWGIQDQQRAQSWGWRQEDFAENIRFMSGRDRRLAERQMQRETIQFGQEGEQINVQRQRQKETWKMEDDRYRLQKQQFEEQAQLQELNAKKQKEFYEEGQRLQDQSIALQREYWKKQYDLQLAAAGAANKYAQEQVKLSQTMLEFSQYSEKATGEGKLFNAKTLADLNTFLLDNDPLMQKFLENLKNANTILNPDYVPSNAPADNTDNSSPEYGDKKAGGGPLFAGVPTLVGESGMEIINSSIPGSIMANNEVMARNYGQTSKVQSYWNNSYLSQGQGTSKGGPVTIIVNIGSEQFKKYIVDTVENAVVG